MDVITNLQLEIDKNLSNFLGDTKGENELQIILRGHLYIEHEIEKLLRFALVEPDYILNERFMFMNKLNLAVALGVIPKNRLGGYKKLNGIRNKYSHQLKFALSEKDLNDLISVLSVEVRELYESIIIKGEDRKIAIVKCIIAALWTDAMRCVLNNQISFFEKAFDRIEELKNPPSKEELLRRDLDVKKELFERFMGLSE
ncbi:hypothetical protein ACDX66_00810 [Peribacillus frigoritolerans]